MFDLMFIIVPIMFFIIFGIVIVSLIGNLFQWNKNNHSPVLIVDAKVVTKRLSVSHHHTNDNMGFHSNTTYYVTFEVESKDRIEFIVSGKEYGMLCENDMGKLTFQGTRYKGFERV